MCRIGKRADGNFGKGYVQMLRYQSIGVPQRTTYKHAKFIDILEETIREPIWIRSIPPQPLSTLLMFLSDTFWIDKHIKFSDMKWFKQILNSLKLPGCPMY